MKEKIIFLQVGKYIKTVLLKVGYFQFEEDKTVYIIEV